MNISTLQFGVATFAAKSGKARLCITEPIFKRVVRDLVEEYGDVTLSPSDNLWDIKFSDGRRYTIDCPKFREDHPLLTDDEIRGAGVAAHHAKHGRVN